MLLRTALASGGAAKPFLYDLEPPALHVELLLARLAGSDEGAD